MWIISSKKPVLAQQVLIRMKEGHLRGLFAGGSGFGDASGFHGCILKLGSTTSFAGLVERPC